VSRYRGNGDRCKKCGLTYGKMRTGLTYRDVWLMLWHKTEFRYKRRGTILGLWHSIKKSMWEHHLDVCGKPPPEGDSE